MLSLVPTSCSFHEVGKAVSHLSALASVADELNENEEQWWNDADRRKPKFWDKKTCPIATSYTTNLTWTDLESNPVIRDDSSATDRVNLGRAHHRPVATKSTGSRKILDSSCCHLLLIYLRRFTYCEAKKFRCESYTSCCSVSLQDD
jgi:hypothetical protein